MTSGTPGERKSGLFGSISKKLSHSHHKNGGRKSLSNDGDNTAATDASMASTPTSPNTPKNRTIPVSDQVVAPTTGEPDLQPTASHFKIKTLLSRNPSSASGDHRHKTTHGSPVRHSVGSSDIGSKGVNHPDGPVGTPMVNDPHAATNGAAGTNGAAAASGSDEAGGESQEHETGKTSETEGLVFSLMLNEAMEDTPSFRASAAYLDAQFKELEKWLDNLSAKNTHVVKQLNNVKNSVNDVIEIFMPSVTNCSILAQDYTTLLFSRYTEAEQMFWSELFVHAARNAQSIVDMVRRLKEVTFAKYHEANKLYTRDLAAYTKTMRELFLLPNDAEPGAVREATHRLNHAKRQFLHHATQLVVVVSDVEADTSVSLLETLSHHFTSPDNGFLTRDTQRINISVELYRLHAAATTMRQSMPGLNAELKDMRRELLKQPASTEKKGNAPVKAGWLRVEVAPQNWQILWGYVQHGLFGFLSLSTNQTAVIESSRFLCQNSKLTLVEDRELRCLFQVTNQDGRSYRMQALCQEDLDEWQAAYRHGATARAQNHRKPIEGFQVAQAQASAIDEVFLEKTNGSIANSSSASGQESFYSVSPQKPAANGNATSTPLASPAHGHHLQLPDQGHGHGHGQANGNVAPQTKAIASSPEWSQRDLQPWNKAFGIPGMATGAAPGAEVVVAKLDDFRVDINSKHWLKYDTTLTSNGAMEFDLKVPSIKPLPTSVQLEAMVANSFFQPDFTCNAITANLWGSAGTHLPNPDELSEHHVGFPPYPDNYPRSLMYQDMDMRCIVAQLPPEQRMIGDEIMLSVIRCTITLRRKDVPARLYLTNRRILIYSSWRGIVSLNSYPIQAVLDVTTEHGVDYSILQITVQDAVHAGTVAKTEESGTPKPESTSEPIEEFQSLEFKLFIDSAVLAKRKLDYIKENSRSATPMNCHDLLGELGLISIEHSDYLKDHEEKTLKKLEWNQGTAVQKSHQQKSILKNGNIRHGKPAISEEHSKTFAGWLLSSVVGEGSHRGEEDAMEMGKGMKTKQAEDTFPVSAETLFLAIFGSRSPVFTGTQNVIMDIETHAGVWYRQGRRTERRVQEKFKNGKDTQTRYNIQRVDQQQPDLFMVSERRAPWELPSGDQFHVIMKYVIYATNQGCNLQIWSRVVWKASPHKKSEVTVNHTTRLLAQAILVHVRDATVSVNSVREAREKFGSVRPTKVIAQTHNHRDEEKLENQVTRVTPYFLLQVIMRWPFAMTSNAHRLTGLFSYVCAAMSRRWLFMIFFIVSSLISNFVLYQHSREGYWTEVLETRHTNTMIDSLRLAPHQHESFSRAIYMQDLNDLIASGKMWDKRTAELTNSTNYGGCTAKFAEIAQMSQWATDYGTLYSFEPRIESALTKITSTRLEFAKKRNELLTMVRVLNHKEEDALDEEYRHWLVSETAMCSTARSTLPMLNHTVSAGITSYCISCLEEARAMF